MRNDPTLPAPDLNGLKKSVLNLKCLFNISESLDNTSKELLDYLPPYALSEYVAILILPHLVVSNAEKVVVNSSD